MNIYYMTLTGDRNSKMNTISSLIVYDRLGYTRPPQTIRELFEMDRRGETQVFNENKEFVRRELTQRWREIPTRCNEDDNFALGISRKIKYCYIANNIRLLHPRDDLTATSNISDLLLTLQVLERDFE